MAEEETFYVSGAKHGSVRSNGYSDIEQARRADSVPRGAAALAGSTDADTDDDGFGRRSVAGGSDAGSSALPGGRRSDARRPGGVASLSGALPEAAGLAARRKAGRAASDGGLGGLLAAGGAMDGGADDYGLLEVMGLAGHAGEAAAFNPDAEVDLGAAGLEMGREDMGDGDYDENYAAPSSSSSTSGGLFKISDASSSTSSGPTSPSTVARAALAATAAAAAGSVSTANKATAKRAAKAAAAQAEETVPALLDAAVIKGWLKDTSPITRPALSARAIESSMAAGIAAAAAARVKGQWAPASAAGGAAAAAKRAAASIGPAGPSGLTALSLLTMMDVGTFAGERSRRDRGVDACH